MLYFDAKSFSFHEIVLHFDVGMLFVLSYIYRERQGIVSPINILPKFVFSTDCDSSWFNIWLDTLFLLVKGSGDHEDIVKLVFLQNKKVLVSLGR